MSSLGPKELSVLARIKGDEAAKAYFFRKLSSNPDAKWFEALRSDGYFSAENNPPPVSTSPSGGVSVPYWQVLPYLVGLAKRSQEADFANIAKELMTIVLGVANAAESLPKEKDNAYTWQAFVEIMTNLPVALVEDAVVHVRRWIGTPYGGSFVGTDVVTKLLPHLLQSDVPGQELAECVIDYATDVVWKEMPEIKRALHTDRTNDADLVVEPFWIQEALIHKGCAKTAGAKCSRRLIETVARKLKELIVRLYPDATGKSPPDDRSLLWCNSVANGSGPHQDDPEQITTCVLRDLLAGKVESDPAGGRAALAGLLSPEYDLPIFGRIALHVASLHWDDVKDTIQAVPDCVLVDWLTRLPFEQEMIALLKATAPSGTDPFPFVARIRSAVRSMENCPAKERWIRRLAGEDVKSPTEFRFDVRVGPGPSPKTESETQEMSGSDLAAFLHEFREQHPWEGPTVGGLCETLKNAVKQNPSGFAPKLRDLKDVTYGYAESILWGYWDAWKEQHQFDWGEVLSYAWEYTHRGDFWSDEPVTPGGHWQTKHRGVVSMVAELLVSGTEKDAWAMDPRHTDAAEQLVFYLFDKLKLEAPPEWDDPLAEALNTVEGKVLMAMLYLALRRSRLSRSADKESGGFVWQGGYQARFEKAFNQKYPQVYTYLGYYLFNFLFLDSSWTAGWVKKLEGETDDRLWRSFVYGFLFHQNISPSVFEIMKQHFQRAWTDRELHANSERGLVNVVLTAYLREYEELQRESFTYRLVDDWNARRLEVAVQFLESVGKTLDEPDDEKRRLRPEQVEKIRSRVIAVWKAILDTGATRKSDPSTTQIMPDVSRLIVYVPKLDGAAWELVRPSLPYLRADHDSYVVLEHLNRLTEGLDTESVSYAGQALLSMLANFHADYRREDITAIVERLFQASDKDCNRMARQISESYAQKCDFGLKPIYEKYTNKEGGDGAREEQI